MLSRARVLQQFIGTSKVMSDACATLGIRQVMSGACATLGIRHQLDEICANAAQVYSEQNTEFS